MGDVKKRILPLPCNFPCLYVLNPVQETSSAAILANILPGRGIDEFFTRTDVVAGTTSNFLTDALGSPIAVTDNTGVVQTEYTYDPFGKTTFARASNSNSFQYTGRENDGMGLYYYRTRFYYSQLQRFVSEDPFNLETIHTQAAEEIRSTVTHQYLQEYFSSANLYTYVDNKPLIATDPLGLCVGGSGLGATIGAQVGLGAGLGALGGAIGARKPLAGAGVGASAGKTFGALAALTPRGTGGAIVGAVTGAAIGASVGAATSGGTLGGVIGGAFSGAVGGIAGGAIGGFCGSIVGAGVGMGIGHVLGWL
jgi:RHS repeat-associated protein